MALVAAALAAEPAAVIGSGDPVEALPVRERPRPGYDPIGVRLGSILVYQSLKASAFRDSNIFARPADPVADSGLKLAPRLWTQSQFPRHALDLELGIDRYQYARHTSESRTDAFARVQGRLDLQRDLVALTLLNLAIRHEDRGSPDSPPLAAEPVRYRQLEGGVTVNKTFNRLALSVGGVTTWRDYRDVARLGGGRIDQAFRDHVVHVVGGRLAYAFMTGQRVFADVRVNWRRYPKAPVVRLDSHGFQALAGFEFALTSLVMGQVGLGYLRQSYDDPRMPDVSGAAYLVDVIWNPTPLMTVTFKGERSVQEGVGLALVARIESSFQAILDYELLRNLIISPSIRFAHEDYRGIARTDRVIEPAVTVDYLVNRHFAMGATYTFTSRTSSMPATGFDRHQAMIHAKAQF